jgi:hypothetical protein
MFISLPSDIRSDGQRELENFADQKVVEVHIYEISLLSF